MNPRVSRSSALASKATGLPDRQDRRAPGGRLHARGDPQRHHRGSRRRASSRRSTTCVVKWPRFAFEKFPGVDADLTTHMKSVGEAMAIGRTFQQAFAKALRSRELDIAPTLDAVDDDDAARARSSARAPTASTSLLEALPPRRDASTRSASARHRPVVPARAARARARSGRAVRRRADVQVGRHLRGRVRGAHAVLLLGLGARGAPPHEVERGERPSVVILGSGPNRIGQGIEFDYCCVHAADDRPRVRPRRGDDQLQPRDGLHRLRHLRPPVLRAADARGRARRSSRSSGPRA